MVRLLRLQFPNALYHVTSREVRCGNIYEDDDDRLRFLEILGAQSVAAASVVSLQGGQTAYAIYRLK